MRTQSRREFFETIIATGAAVTGLRAQTSSTAAPQAGGPPSKNLPRPASSGIDHIVVVCMENRSFDHFLGWLPGANGRQSGLTYPTPTPGVYQPTWYLGTDYQGCSYKDPDHSWSGGRIEYDGGACDGWLLDSNNDVYCIGYYMQQDLPFLGNAAVDWTACDNYFSAIMAPTYPNRIYLHAGVTDRITQSLTISTLPTIWDRLAAAHVPARYYYTDTSFLDLWGLKYVGISSQIASFYLACASGSLPAVSYVDPGFNGESTGTSTDDHPHGNIQAGEYFLNQVYNAVTSSPQWSKTALVITFDEWGGFFDHVPPGTAPDVNVAYELRGFRVPAIVISPLAQRNTVAHNIYDHTSILKMIEWRWNLKPLSVRDRYANNIAEVLNFGAPNTSFRSYTVPPPATVGCT